MRAATKFRGEGRSMVLASFKHLAWVGCLAAAATLTPSSQAASITAQLDCTLEFLKDNGTCDGVGPYGSVKIEDGFGDVRLTVDLLNPSLKFKDLILAFDGGATGITDDDPNNVIVLSSNSFSLGPYAGFFDIGDNTTAQGWNGDSGYSVILTGVGDVLSLGDFLGAFDTGGNLSVALHIQNIGDANGESCSGASNSPTCVPGQTGPGSLFVGGVFDDGGGDIPPIPEPSTMLLMGGALLGLGLIRKKRNS